MLVHSGSSKAVEVLCFEESFPPLASITVCICPHITCSVFRFAPQCEICVFSVNKEGNLTNKQRDMNFENGSMLCVQATFTSLSVQRATSINSFKSKIFYFDDKEIFQIWRFEDKERLPSQIVKIFYNSK